MKIITNYEKLKDEFILILNLFYSKEKVENSSDELTLNIFDNETNFAMSLTYKNKTYKKSFSLTDDEMKNKFKYIKKNAKVFLYEVVSRIEHKKIPYGSLTGIRPTKLFHELLAECGDFNKVEKILLNEYRVSKDKVKLLGKIVRNQTIDKVQNKVDLYINIPFCTSKCYYCSFISLPIDKCSNFVEPYINALIKDIKNALKMIRQKKLVLENIYMGGGTPSALSADQLEKILKVLPTDISEFTVECGRPDTISKEKLEVLEKMGVTRISVNPQTFNDKTLQLIGRSHNSKETIEAYNLARNYNFQINMDLIAGLGEEKLKDFKSTLLKTISLNPDNITVHTLCLKRASSLNLDGGKTSNEIEVEKMVKFSINKLLKNGYNPYYLYKQKNALANLENIGYFKGDSICKFNVNSMEETRSVVACGANAISKYLEIESNRIERVAFVKEPKEYIERLDEMLIKRENLFKDINNCKKR